LFGFIEPSIPIQIEPDHATDPAGAHDAKVNNHIAIRLDRD
jgi:hypothetical protein